MREATKFKLKFKGGTAEDISLIELRGSFDYSSSLRPERPVTVISATQTVKKEKDSFESSNWDEPFFPVLEGTLPGDIGETGVFALIRECKGSQIVYLSGDAEITAVSDNNSLDQSSASFRSFIKEYTIYEKDSQLFPMSHTKDLGLRDLSSFSYSYDYSTGDDYGAYKKPANAKNEDYPGTGIGSEEGSSIYTVTINVVGDKTSDGKKKIENAQDGLNKIKNFFNSKYSNIQKDRLLIQDGRPFDKVVSTSTDYYAGSITETVKYTVYGTGIHKPFRESYDLRVDTNARQADFFTTVSINGTVQGLNTKSSDTDDLADNRHTNMNKGWLAVKLKIHDRVKDFMPEINPVPISKNFTYAEDAIINYNYTYDTRPISLVSGALSESLVMSDSFQSKEIKFAPTNKYHTINMGSYTLPSRTVTYRGQFSKKHLIPGSIHGMINNAIEQFDPAKLDDYISSSESSNTYNHDISNNIITATKEWIYYINN